MLKRMARRVTGYARHALLICAHLLQLQSHCTLSESCRATGCVAKHGDGHVQVNQFEGILQHCLATPGVHVIELPIDYAVSAQLQVSP